VPEVKERAPTAALSGLLAEFDRIGGVVDFVIIDAEELSDLDVHRAAAVFGMETWAARVRAQGSLFQLAMSPDKAQSERISAGAFFGGPAGGGFAQGFESAFKEPPYGMSKPVSELYAAIVHELGLLDPGLEIMRWSTDWSNYFDAGHEWWGAHLWTLRHADGPLLWIGASSTD